MRKIYVIISPTLAYSINKLSFLKLRSTLSAGRSDLRQTGRENWSNHRYLEPVEVVAFIDMKISHSTSFELEHMEVNMKENRSIRITGNTTSNIQISLKVKALSYLVTTLLVMVAFFNHSA